MKKSIMIFVLTIAISLSAVYADSSSAAEVDAAFAQEKSKKALDPAKNPGAPLVTAIESAAKPKAKTADEIAKELANPATPMSTIGNQLEYRRYKGTLPGADDQDSWVYTLQPAFPFTVGNGEIVAVRPAIPVILSQPVFDTNSNGFTSEGPELGDIAFDAIYGKTYKSGLIALGGLFGVLPTHTDSAVGSDQWRLGPEVLIGKIQDWGVVGVLAFHQWNVAGGTDEPDTSVTSIQYLYAIGLGGGWQLASSPTITYDWEADSDNAWNVPIGVGLAKTLIIKNKPWKVQGQVFYYLEQPDDFGQAWGFKLSVSPVVPNPFVKSKK